MAFFNRVNSLLEPNFTILDVGCGRGAYAEDRVHIRRNLRVIKGKVKKVVGIDVDKSAEGNPNIDEFHLIEGSDWPVDSDSIDLILCDNVLEHIEEPKVFFAEASRVLHNNGYLCIRTPNSWSYIGLFSRIIPNKYHSKITNAVQDNRKEDDVFPTFYLCNNLRLIKKMMAKYQFESIVYGYAAEPSYLSFSKLAYWLGVIHQRFAPSFLKPAIFAFGTMHKMSR